ncbi:ArsR/SmtB family transcription factor [Neptunicella sp. SCSIO 80796]|uniref:ArsR/SmtB family transcription factor n=1 Tax=Neptunicella plasticusilytica TaxID=3117012 RepID=UPI003A4D90FD
MILIQPDITVIANAIGEPSRAKMLIALMSGKALTATELALEADITAQTASSHLLKLVNSQLLVVRKQGRHKYFQLKDHTIAELLEQLLNISAGLNTSSTVTGPDDIALKQSRICYDHLAGERGVALYRALVEQNILVDKADTTILTESGNIFFRQLGVDIDLLSRAKRPLCKSCLDWSERVNHLAGSLGKWILQDALTRQWSKQDMDSRVIRFNPSGIKQFYKKYAIDPLGLA